MLPPVNLNLMTASGVLMLTSIIHLIKIRWKLYFNYYIEWSQMMKL